MRRGWLCGSSLTGMVILVGVAASCGDDDGSSPAADVGPPPADGAPVDAGPRQDAGADSDAGAPDSGPALEDVELVVTRYGGSQGAPGEPAEGAVVAMELPDGTVVEAEVDASGRVAFRDVDTSQAPIAFTSYLEGHVPVSVIGLAVAQAQGVPVYAVAPPLEVELSGTAAGMMDPAHRLNVFAIDTFSTAHNGDGPSWSVPVPRGVPATLVGIEYELLSPPLSVAVEQRLHAWTIADTVTPTADAMVSLDLADPARRLAAHDVAGGFFALPARADSPLRTTSSAYVVAFDRAADGTLVGPNAVPTRIAPDDARTRVDFDAQYVDLPGVDHSQAITRYVLQASPVYALVVAEGLPKSGDALIEFLDVPEATTAGPLALEPGTEITIDRRGAERAVQTQLYLQRRGNVRWVITAEGTDERTATLRIPALPSVADRAAVLGSGSLDAVPNVCEPSTSMRGYCARITTGRALEATP